MRQRGGWRETIDEGRREREKDRGLEGRGDETYLWSVDMLWSSLQQDDENALQEEGENQRRKGKMLERTRETGKGSGEGGGER